MNSERKNYPMKRISGNFSDFINFGHHVEKKTFLNISCNSKCMGFTYIWVPDLNLECKNCPMKEFRAILPISSILVIRSGYAKKGNLPVLAVFQNIWDLHKFGLQIWIRTQKLPYERISGNFFDFIDFGHQVRVVQKKVISQY